MQLDKPKLRRVYVQFVDPDGEPGKTVTVYNTTLQQVVDEFTKFLSDRDSSNPDALETARMIGEGSPDPQPTRRASS